MVFVGEATAAMAPRSGAMAAPARRVLIIVENLPVPFDRRVWAEARSLRAAGYGVAVICPKARRDDAAHEYLEGIHIYRHPAPLEARGALGYVLEYGNALFWELFYALKVQVRHGFDVIHACNPPDLIFLVAGFFKLFGKKFLFDHHDLNPELYESKFSRRDHFWKLLCVLERLTFRLADVSIATNESYRRVALQRGGMADDRVFTVRSGPDLDRVRELPPDPGMRNGRRHLVAYIGVIGEQEGIDLLLQAMERIVKVRRREDVQLIIMGSGPQWQAERERAQVMGLQDHVTFTGRVDDTTLFTALSTADVCVNPDRPSAMNDMSTMNKIMEYMTLGKPIVQFDLAEGRVSAREASLYARDTDDFADKILSLLDDPEARRRMGEVGRHRVHDSLAWRHEMPKLLAAYDRLWV